MATDMLLKTHIKYNTIPKINIKIIKSFYYS